MLFSLLTYSFVCRSAAVRAAATVRLSNYSCPFISPLLCCASLFEIEECNSYFHVWPYAYNERLLHFIAFSPIIIVILQFCWHINQSGPVIVRAVLGNLGHMTAHFHHFIGLNKRKLKKNCIRVMLKFCLHLWQLMRHIKFSIQVISTFVRILIRQIYRGQSNCSCLLNRFQFCTSSISWFYHCCHLPIVQLHCHCTQFILKML